MFEAYRYIPSNEAEDVIDCGMKLSKWYDRVIHTETDVLKCISALLTPRDEISKLKSDCFKCVKLSVQEEHCFIADRSLYSAGLEDTQIAELYQKSVIPADKYTLGDYRLPEVLIISTVIKGQISLANNRLDSPILYENSRKLFINTLIENYEDQIEDLNEKMLYCYYSKLAQTGVIEKYEYPKHEVAVFVSKRSGKIVTTCIPDFSCDVF